MQGIGVSSLPSPMGGSQIQRAIKFYSSNGRDASVADAPSKQVPGEYVGYFSGSNILGQPFSIFLGLVALLGLLKWFSESDATALNPGDVEINGYNVMAVGVTSAVFIAVLKILFNRVPIPGLTQFANFL